MLASAAAYVLLTVLVVADLTADVDAAAKELFRPGDMWSTPQFLVGDVIDGLAPLHVVAGVGVLVAAYAIRRRTWHPLAVTGALLLVVAAATWVSKVLVDRPDTHGSESGASYPSGHVAVLLVALGALALLWGRQRRWAWPAVVVVVVVMAVSLLVQATHWLTDIVGAALLGAATLSGFVALARGDHPGSGRHGDRVEPASCPNSPERHVCQLTSLPCSSTMKRQGPT
jgi:MYXO-CTERM domain-containing protein